MRDVADIRVTVERKRVVLAERVELDRSLDDLADVAVRPAVALSRESSQKLGVTLVAAGRLEQRVDVTSRRFSRAGGIEVHPQGLEDLGRVAFELLPLLRCDVAWADLLPLRGLFWIKCKRRHAVLLQLARTRDQCR